MPPDDASASREAERFAAYLTGRRPSQAEVGLYVRALGTGRFRPSARDARTLSWLDRHPRLIAVVDGGLALRRPQSVVRLRLLVMAAILEASPRHASLFLPERRSRWYVLRAGAVSLRAAIRGVLGAILVTWI
jgi:hypothetical protein